MSSPSLTLEPTWHLSSELCVMQVKVYVPVAQSSTWSPASPPCKESLENRNRAPEYCRGGSRKREWEHCIENGIGILLWKTKQAKIWVSSLLEHDQVKFQLRASTGTHNPFANLPEKAQMKGKAPKPLKAPKLFACEGINQKALRSGLHLIIRND